MTATVLGTAAAVCWIYLLALHGGFWRIRPEPARVPALSRRVVAVIPARDEAAVIGRAVSSLLMQRCRGSFHLIVVDDHSSDGTAEKAQAAAAALGAADRLSVFHHTGRQFYFGARFEF